MDDAVIYQKLADDCFSRARIVYSPESAAGLQRLGTHWLRKAANAQPGSHQYRVPHDIISNLDLSLPTSATRRFSKL